ncbi:MAG TPA: translocation/assembly module TamB domain-containing protein [Thermodesulfovibrionales bacterium]|nr:translocation/assembly module TamB domain-containing protein [Thermodesulfovibrionales bacterium]
MGENTVKPVKTMIRERKKAVVWAVSAVLCIAGLFFIARGTYLSNYLKRLILPELSEATGREVMVQKISVNIFPLFIEARELRLLDHGNEVLRIPRIKVYVSLLHLAQREIILKRVAIREPLIRTDAAQVKDIVEKIRQYLEREKKSPLKAVVRAVVLDQGAFVFSHPDMSFNGSGFGAEILFPSPRALAPRSTAVPRLSLHIKNLIANVRGLPELKAEIKGLLALNGEVIEVKGLQVGVYGSMLHASGTYTQGRSDLEVRLGLLAESFKRLFNLKKPGEGEVSAKGTVRLLTDDLPGSAVDLDLKGDFYIQTLMELVKVMERIEGAVSFTGSLKGPLRAVRGTAKARLKKGNLFDVDLDELTCKVDYEDGKLVFSDGRASLYHGKAGADAVVAIAGTPFYSLRVNFEDVDSAGVFKLIKWDPGIPAGKVKGELSTSGDAFNPAGWFDYHNTAEGSDILGRVKKAKGSFSLNGDLLSLAETEVSTARSSLIVKGDVDLKASTLSLKAEMTTSDTTDLTVPYLHELTGSGGASGTVKGEFDNPVISARLTFHSVSYDGYPFGSVNGDLSYRKDLLEIRDLAASVSMPWGPATAALKGTIGFTGAQELFDFKLPRYALTASVKNNDFEKAVRLLYRKPLDPHPTGQLDADVNITGAAPTPHYQGSLRIQDLKAGALAVDSARSSFSYDYRDFVLKEAVLTKGDSVLSGEGTMSADDHFVFAASGEKILLRDLFPKALSLDAAVTFSAQGRGTLDAPVVDMEGTFHNGRFKSAELGDGTLKAALRAGTLSLNALFFHERVSLSGKAELKGDLPWTARLDVKPGRYEFLAAAFMKEVPEDLFINMKGYADMSGDRNHFAAKAVVNQVNMTIYGNSLSNGADMHFEIKDRKVSMPDFTLRSGNIFIRMNGSVELGKEYDLVVEGKSALFPLKLFSKKIDVIRGDAQYRFSVSGAWDNPRFNGGIELTDGLLSLKDIRYRMSAMSGSLLMDGDRIIIQKLVGKVGGGDVSFSGVAYTRGLKIGRFYVDAVMDSVGLDISNEFTANVSGNLLYRGTLDAQTLSGEVRINRAKYREPIQWESWLFKARARERPRGEITPLEKIQVNVKVQGTENIVIDNNLARASLSADLVLRGTAANLLIFGRIDSKSGTVYFRNNDFRILYATADFADARRINPTVNVLAETDIEGYTIRLNLEGQVEQFSLSLSSTPSLDQAEILSLLTGGTLSREPKGIQSGIGVSTATSFLSGQVQSLTQERVRSITGIDRIGVESSVSRITGKTEQRVAVSKRLGDRVTVTYSTALGSVATDVIKVEYTIGSKVSLIGIRDEVGALGGGVKFRFGFK